MFSSIKPIKSLSPAETTPPEIAILMEIGETIEKCYVSNGTAVGFSLNRIIIRHTVKSETWITTIPYGRIANMSIILNKSGKHTGFCFVSANGSTLETRFSDGADREGLHQFISRQIGL